MEPKPKKFRKIRFLIRVVEFGMMAFTLYRKFQASKPQSAAQAKSKKRSK
jgi:hypothetical protein